MSAVQVVLKERRSSGGHGVSLVVGADVPDDERFVVQELVAWRDDLRAMVVNGRVEHWLRRRPREGEWRSNLAQGASYESAHDVSPAAEAMAVPAQLAMAAMAVMGLEEAGVGPATRTAMVARLVLAAGLAATMPERAVVAQASAVPCL